MFCEKGVLRNFGKFTGKHLRWLPIIIIIIIIIVVVVVIIIIIIIIIINTLFEFGKIYESLQNIYSLVFTNQK